MEGGWVQNSTGSEQSPRAYPILRSGKRAAGDVGSGFRQSLIRSCLANDCPRLHERLTIVLANDHHGTVLQVRPGLPEEIVLTTDIRRESLIVAYAKY